MIYLDNAATSWPKPEQVYQAVDKCLRTGGNPGRGVNQSSLNMSRVVFEARYELADFFNCKNEERIIFTKNVTEGINIALKNVLQPGDHVLISPYEHNAVVRPLEYLKEHREITYDIIPGDCKGHIDLTQMRALINQKTKLIIVAHASNILGTILPIEDIVDMAKDKGVLTLIDEAQTAGGIPIDFDSLGADYLAFTGHKGLLGPQGTGGLVVKEGINMEPIIHGGTGVDSRSIRQTNIFPDDFESGTKNVPGIAGLLEGVRYCKQNLECIRQHEQKLITKLLDYFANKPEIEYYGSDNSQERVGLVTFNIKNVDSDQVGIILDQEYGIVTRTGLHCSPLAHKTAGTLDLGGVRVSVGPFTKESEIQELIKALDEIIY